jgi:hypothetical protein
MVNLMNIPLFFFLRNGSWLALHSLVGRQGPVMTYMNDGCIKNKFHSTSQDYISSQKKKKKKNRKHPPSKADKKNLTKINRTNQKKVRA